MCSSLFWGRKGPKNRCSCCRGRPPVLLRVPVGSVAAVAVAQAKTPDWPYASLGQRDGAGVGGPETGPAIFLAPGGRSREAQRSGSSPWKRSFCSSGQDRNGTVSCRGHRHRALIARGLCERNLAVATLWPSPTSGTLGGRRFRAEKGGGVQGWRRDRRRRLRFGVKLLTRQDVVRRVLSTVGSCRRIVCDSYPKRVFG
jgi:hypothetical protein